jgi:hypothetical protein
LNAFGQADGWESPFPYNPDGDSDGYIGLNDLLDLLALYGNEYPDSFHYDDSGALLNLGQMGYRECMISAEEAEGNWRILTFKDWNKWFDQIAAFGSSSSSDISWDMYTYAYNPTSGKPCHTRLVYGVNNQSFGITNLNYAKFYWETSISNYGGDNYCFIVTEVRPPLEYHVCLGSALDVTQEVNDSLSNGWSPIGGFNRDSESNCTQAIWRWAIE